MPCGLATAAATATPQHTTTATPQHTTPTATMPFTYKLALGVVSVDVIGVDVIGVDTIVLGRHYPWP